MSVSKKLNRRKRFVFKPEVLDRTGMTFVSIWRWMGEGKFPAAREVGNKIAWLESEIDEWMASRPKRQYYKSPREPSEVA